MKSILLTALWLAMFVGMSHAQPMVAQPSLYKMVKIEADSVHWVNSISIMPLSLFGLGLELAYEHHLPNTFTSVRVNSGVFLGTDPWFYDAYKKYSGFRVEAQVRFHLMTTEYAKEGFYVGPYLQYKRIQLEKPFLDPSRTDMFIRSTGAIGGGFLLGYQSRFRSRLLVDAYFGGGLITSGDDLGADEGHIDFVNPYKQGITFHGGFGFGFLPTKRRVRQ
jgi:Protein of unknown function (DUF3575)